MLESAQAAVGVENATDIADGRVRGCTFRLGWARSIRHDTVCTGSSTLLDTSPVSAQYILLRLHIA